MHYTCIDFLTNQNVKNTANNSNYQIQAQYS